MALWILKADYQRPRFELGQSTVPKIAPLDAIFEHHWRYGLEFTLIDVGAKYGLSTIVAANYIYGRRHHSPIVAFEPGAAADLIGRNLALNHLNSRVALEVQAVSDRCGEAVIYSEPTHPEDNHIIRRNINRDFDTKVIPTISLDAYTESKHIEPPLIVKVDTQGAEWEVWTGMRRLVHSGPVTILTEFTPWTFEGRAEPPRFLRELAELYDLIDINPKNMAGSFEDSEAGFHLVASESFGSFTQSVAASAGGWTDLLCIPRGLSHNRELLNAILSA